MLITWTMYWTSAVAQLVEGGTAWIQRWLHVVSLTKIPDPKTSPRAVMDLSTADQCMLFLKRPPSTVSSHVLEIHPGFLFPSITWQQTHHFISVLSLWAETSQRDSSGEDEQRPTWLTYQWRVRHIPSARSVTHKWSWQHAAPNPPVLKKILLY